uniref:Uncharacterized protein n=1 Tax=Rhipicephalus appendiculatus TaxID=34631 RepID=A0A131YCL7_RHIAP
MDTLQRVLLTIGNTFREAVFVARVCRFPKLSNHHCMQQILLCESNVCVLAFLTLAALTRCYSRLVLLKPCCAFFNFILVRRIGACMYIFLGLLFSVDLSWFQRETDDCGFCSCAATASFFSRRGCTAWRGSTSLV